MLEIYYESSVCSVISSTSSINSRNLKLWWYVQMFGGCKHAGSTNLH